MKKLSKKAVFKDFIDKNDVLIVDKNPGSRSRLIKTFVDLGSKKHMIHSAGSFEEAVEIINSKNIGIILSDYFISGGSGFDLFKIIREKNPKKKMCLILVTSDMGQSIVAKAAEEDVDSYIIKPYTVDSIQENLINTISDKIQPPQYIQVVDEAKLLIEDSQFDEAIKKLQFAATLHPKPSLALFYIGKAEYLKELNEEAQTTYQKGLSFNNIHFKCLLGLYDMLLEKNHLDQAYEVVKKIAKFYPANDERLSQIIRLTVQTKNFQDMLNYYQLFTSMDVRSSLITNYIGSGLYVSGKYFLKKRETNLALRIFESMAISCSEYTKFLKAAVSLLIEFEMVPEAEKFLKRFPAGTHETQDYFISDFLVEALKFKDKDRTVKKGLELYNKKIHDRQCMELMIKAMQDSGYKEEKIQPFIEAVA